MTSGIEHRVFQHKTHAFPGFTAKYNVINLVHFERYGSVMTAIRREKEMKAWRREEKIKLIETSNPKWEVLSYGWNQRHQFQPDRKQPIRMEFSNQPHVILRRATALRRTVRGA